MFKKVFNPFRSRDTELEIARGQRLINSLSEELEGLDDTKAEDIEQIKYIGEAIADICLLYTSPSPRDLSTSRMPSSA